MDQAPVQEIDLHEGLNNTLIMLQAKLKRGIEVERNYGEDVPRIDALGSELNQVWTNLIDNAADAMGGSGHLMITTSADDGWVVVEIEGRRAGNSGRSDRQGVRTVPHDQGPGQGNRAWGSTSYSTSFGGPAVTSTSVPSRGAPCSGCGFPYAGRHDERPDRPSDHHRRR
jgi:hypothetical protein